MLRSFDSLGFFREVIPFTDGAERVRARKNRIDVPLRGRLFDPNMQMFSSASPFLRVGLSYNSTTGRADVNLTSKMLLRILMIFCVSKFI